MNPPNTPGAIRKTVAVQCDIYTAFRTWTEQINIWWPKSHSRSGDPATTVHLERHPDGRIYERTSEGIEYVWGKVVTWDPPRHFAYHWYLGTSPEQPTHVDVLFTPEETQATRVEITHRGPEFIGDIWTRNSTRYDAAWDGVLPAYVAACGTQHPQEEQIK